MKRLLIAAAALSIVGGLASEVAAKEHGRWDRRGGHDNGLHRGHYKWRQGGRIDRYDWNRGYRVDYRRYHLRAPPRGYEWRRVDDSYVLAAVATGLIVSILAAN